ILASFMNISSFSLFIIHLRNIWLLLASLVFYAWGEPVFIFLMILSICVNYLFGRWVEKHNKKTKSPAGKRIVALACVFNLGILFVFKYLAWILSMLRIDAGSLAGLPLPIGISFYTFQALSYVIDVYKGKDKAQKSIIDVGLYISFFPQLIAGPIVRYGTISRQLKSREHSWDKFSAGVWRFTIGLAKKILIANQVAQIADLAFSLTSSNPGLGYATGAASGPSELSVGLAWAGAFAYMLQIYFDFSGYSDMAIGLGKMFGFEFNENFNYPYISKSISEYWRRWHISLGEWFRDYLYYPLSLGPAIKLRKQFDKQGSTAKHRRCLRTDVFFSWYGWLRESGMAPAGRLLSGG
ncbi:MAG: MBOAT family protein, partial [Solobacterium sp.]|nr:MBOAT family protein [Solobacterium sp.]